MNARHPSELALERHLLDPAVSPIASHLGSCEACGARIEEMRRQGEEFARYVFPATVEKVEEAADRRPRLRWLRVLAPVSALAAAAVVFLLVQPLRTPEDYLGVKGDHGLGLTVFLTGTAGARPVRDGEAVPADAAVRFRVQPTSPCHLWLVSVDERGKVSRLFPVEGDGGALVATRFEVPGGAILDGRPGPERVFAICTPGAVYYAAVERAVQAAAARGESAVRSIRGVGGLPAETAQASVLLEKKP